MNRRGFLTLLAGGLAAAADPERLLWTPGRKLISIPAPPTIEPVLFRPFFNVGDIISFPSRALLSGHYSTVHTKGLPGLFRGASDDASFLGGRKRAPCRAAAAVVKESLTTEMSASVPKGSSRGIAKPAKLLVLVATLNGGSENRVLVHPTFQFCEV